MFERDTLSLEEVLNKLNYQDNDSVLNVELTGEWYSWRGSYEHLAVEYVEGGKNYSTIKELIDVLNSALNKGYMYGYKGGEYNINLSTPVIFTTSYRTGFGLAIKNIGFDFDGLKIFVEETD